VNPLWKQNADKVLKAGKLLGLYHFAGEYGEKRTGVSEAEHFLKQIKGYENKAILCLD
jgi:diphthamide synthase (EF-2-diphthine--ammonia ligase)